jgi:hypothetical protein
MFEWRVASSSGKFKGEEQSLEKAKKSGREKAQSLPGGGILTVHDLHTNNTVFTMESVSESNKK